jgi:hypothetical protein
MTTIVCGAEPGERPRLKPSCWPWRASSGQAQAARWGRAAGNGREGELGDRARAEDEAVRRTAVLEVSEFLALGDVGG